MLWLKEGNTHRFMANWKIIPFVSNIDNYYIKLVSQTALGIYQTINPS